MGHYSSPLPRDVLDDATTSCASSSNTNETCYPVALAAFVQGQEASFIWNPSLAQFRTKNRVNITIYDGSGEWDGAIGVGNTILSYLNVVNPATGAGVLKVPVNDSWWGSKGAIWVGNVSYPFFWTIWGAGEDTATMGRQPMFAAIQTALPDSIRATMVSSTPVPTSNTNQGSSAGSITGSITSLPSILPPTGAASSSGASSHRTAIIAGVLCSIVGAALLLSFFFLMRRRRLLRNPPVNTQPDPMLDGFDQKRPLPPSSKPALDREMHTAHEQLLVLRHQLQTQPHTGESQAQYENAELRARIQILTEEVERLKEMGAEAPPAYSTFGVSLE
ncbi:hypothetical protein B0H13DRAFT_1987808 [Mycena leptocephala]|nr:hypothetical protein B0H13DRAFT_1987808 [Mycena leptocephala]